MAESKESFQEKTEQPTGKRKSEARKKGQVSKSMEINSVLILLAGLLSLTIWGGIILNRIMDADRFLFSQIGQIQITPDVLPGYIYSGAKVMLSILVPVLIPIVIIGLVSNIMQVGFLFSLQSIQPKLDKISPMQGIKKMISRKSLVELFKNVLKVSIIGWIGYKAVASLTDDMIPLMDKSVGEIFFWISHAAEKVAYKIVFVIFILAVLDLIYQRWEHSQEMKMTKQEVKDEAKQMDGDPKIKSRIRSIQFKAALQRMMKKVPEASVVITNPTTYAIALAYDADKQGAPVVVAKGKNLIAQRIREIAAEHDIPIIENPPLARSLYKAVDVGQEIPGNFYQAVAEILAYVYRLKGEFEEYYS
ncbi:MAG: flagellar biosynthesis protein FlhB [bacterium]|nr:flagellar biosynthesis protein FlhB [bacterium]